jgi:hypothetical protein
MKRLLVTLCVVAVAACGGDSTSPNIVPPVLDSISPNRGTVGTIVRLNGSAFATDSVNVFFGSLKSPHIDRQGGALFATAPEGLVLGTTYDVRAVNRGGGADTLAGAFQAVAPLVTRINGVTKPTGLIGMTVLIEGDAFGDAAHGKVFFAGPASRSLPRETDQPIVTTVKIPNESGITVQRAGHDASVRKPHHYWSARARSTGAPRSRCGWARRHRRAAILATCSSLARGGLTRRPSARLALRHGRR